MNIFEQALELFGSGQNFAFATIITQDGSAPRSSGSKMIITPDQIYFTIGGGGMEGSVIRIAREEVLVHKKPVIQFYSMKPSEAADSDFICGGEIEVLIDFIDVSDANNWQVFEAAAQAAKDGSMAWLLTVLDSNEGAPHPRQFCLSHGKQGIIGQFDAEHYLAPELIQSPLRTSLHGDQKDGIRYILDPVHTGGTCYIFGGGHVSYAVANVLRTLEFHIVVIDDREKFANPQRFPFCDTMVLSEFDHLDQIETDQNSYLLIMTRGHMFDKKVLEWAIEQDCYYLGMIGSKSKRDIIYDKLRAQGVSQEAIDRVHSPIGLSINAQTPEEIAISIAGELIAERAKKYR